MLQTFYSSTENADKHTNKVLLYSIGLILFFTTGSCFNMFHVCCFCVQLYMSCGMLNDGNELVELLTTYIAHYKKCTSSRQQCVIKRLEEAIVQGCRKEDTRGKVNYL